MKSIHRQCVCTPVIPGPPPASWIQPSGFLSVNCSSFVPRSPLCSQPHRGDLAEAVVSQLWKDGRTDGQPPLRPLQPALRRSLPARWQQRAGNGVGPARPGRWGSGWGQGGQKHPVKGLRGHVRSWCSLHELALVLQELENEHGINATPFAVAIIIFIF